MSQLKNIEGFRLERKEITEPKHTFVTVATSLYFAVLTYNKALDARVSNPRLHLRAGKVSVS